MRRSWWIQTLPSHYRMTTASTPRTASTALVDEAVAAALAAALADEASPALRPPPESATPSLGQSMPPERTEGARDSTPTSEREKVLTQIEDLMSNSSKAKQEAVECEEMGMAPARVMRMRRKSKDFMEEGLSMFASFEPSLERVFDEIDTDKSGFIEPTELHGAFEKLGRKKTQREIKLAVEKLDTNGDGMISLDEFKKLSLLFAQ